MDRRLTAEAAAHMQEGISMVLSRWNGLRMAIDNEWGGRDSLQKSQQLGNQLLNIFTQSKEQVYIDDLEEMFDEFFENSLNMVMDDGSIEEVSEKLMVMHEECLEGNFDSISRLREANPPNAPYARQPGNNDNEDSEDDNDSEDNDGEDAIEANNSSEMEVDAPPSLNVKAMASPDTGKQAPDADGWTVVPSRRNRGRKN